MSNNRGKIDMDRRPAQGRCDRCKKRRKMYMRANEWYDWRISSMNVAGEGKVCWICRAREIDPDFSPGKVMPDIPNGNKFKPAPQSEIEEAKKYVESYEQYVADKVEGKLND